MYRPIITALLLQREAYEATGIFPPLTSYHADIDLPED